MTQFEYLKQFAEETPEWLLNYKSGDKVDFKDFMAGRVGFYPGSGQDGCLMKVGNKSHSVHCFLYVDYMETKEMLRESLTRPGIKGYHSIGTVDWSLADMCPNGIHPVDFPLPACENPYRIVDKTVKPFSFMEIFERDADQTDEAGAERFAVTFLWADGIATYFQLFAKEYKKAPWLFLLQDHGWGGNWNRFGKGGILQKIMERAGCWPSFVLCDQENNVWPGYKMLPDVEPVIGGAHQVERYLYSK